MLHPYLRERLRDLRKHGFCVIEHDLVTEDETIWGGYSVDEFNEQAYEILDGQVFTEERSNGDMVVRKPRNSKEQMQLMIDAKNEMNDRANQAQFMGEKGYLV